MVETCSPIGSAPQDLHSYSLITFTYLHPNVAKHFLRDLDPDARVAVGDSGPWNRLDGEETPTRGRRTPGVNGHRTVMATRRS